MKFYKIILIFFSWCILIPIYGNAQEKINQLDAKGRKTGIWKKYHNNNRIRYEGQFEADKEIGVFKYYSILSSDHPIIIKTFSKDSDITEVVYYKEDGIKESEGKMKGKNRIGKWLYYYPDGKILMIEENYEDGVLNGNYTSYFKNSKLSEQLTYKNGKLNGNIKRFADNGTLLEDLNYVNDVLNGPANYYNVDGKLIYTGVYENDERVGDWKYYNDGKN
ncbi:toxin-antitoxin system YwqK family antitoxin [Lutibacter sp.]|uniref:toxin-antitoxin system YwqK family antitoxin n=1 Tax=Lutibacter sp. TaxID=1925666 RepID=UPI001A1DA9EC|nr:toxin-antitoxin system YwqK family antitoxin [Lutibacter sp.]MBI9042471.1 toxin-antitoxin system YwqK family antitoxin [Lutibacter sp.]